MRLASIMILNIFSAAAIAADGSTATLSRADAGPDLAVQGEYEGTISRDGESVKYGVHIIARGKGKFDAVGYPGGLPGAGWNGEDKVTGSGAREGDDVVIANPEGNAKAVIREGRMTIAIDGEELGELHRVERKSPTLGAKPPAD